jgi:ceramide glucosyltransferase
LWQHELRWARTIRALQPLGFAASAVQFPLFWAAVAVVAAGGAYWSVGLFAFVWAIRFMTTQWIDWLLGRRQVPKTAVSIWHLLLRDMLSVAAVGASFLGNRVVWRGHTLVADNGRAAPPRVETYAMTTADPANAAV